jgi:polyhydroxyalkanoate synthase
MPDAVGKIQDHVSSKDVTFRVTPGGHMGILAGSKAPKASWLELAEWLAARSD